MPTTPMSPPKENCEDKTTISCCPLPHLLFECVKIWPPQLIGDWSKELLMPPRRLSTFTILAKLQLHPPPPGCGGFSTLGDPPPPWETQHPSPLVTIKCSLCLTQHLSFITLMLIAPGKMNFVLGLLPLLVRWGDV